MKKNYGLNGAESQALQAGGKAALELGAKAASEGGLSAEDAVTGTLGVVAAAAAPFVPWGTVASVVIMAGITIFKGVSAAEKAEKDLNKKLDDLTSMKDFVTVTKDTIARAARRPKMPLDLYSGPPMYWIVPSQEIEPEGSPKYYTLPNGAVAWPCSDQGGFTPMANTNKTGVNIDDVYAPFKPNVNNNPSICIFFWAVPIFFARLQQLIGEAKYGSNYDPKAKTKGGITIESELASIIKSIIKYGRLDNAGNWYAKIGPVIPALAFDDDDYAARYYGRNAWVHTLAMQNIKFADGSRISESGIKFAGTQYTKIPQVGQDYYNSAPAKQAISISKKYSEEKPRFVAVAGKPYYLANSLLNTPTPVMNSGHVLDLFNIVSRYEKWDGSHKIARESLRKLPNLSDDTLYYVVSAPKMVSVVKSTAGYNLVAGWPNFRDIEVTNLMADTMVIGGDASRVNWKIYSNAAVKTKYTVAYITTLGISTAANTTTDDVSQVGLNTSDVYKMIIRGAGGFNQLGLSYYGPTLQALDSGSGWNYDFLSSRFHGKFALAPYQLYIAAKTEQIGDYNVPRPYIGPPYAGEGYAQDTIHSTYGFFDFDPEPFAYENVAGLYDGEGKVGKFDWIRNLAIMCGFKADLKGNPDQYKYTTAIQPTQIVNYSDSATDDIMVRKGFNIGDVTSAKRNETMFYRTFDVTSETSGYNEIVKLRPPMKGEPTVKLRKEFWGEGEPWAKLQGTDEVDFAIINSNVKIFTFKRSKMLALSSIGQPLTRAYFKTNLEENKPIVELENKANPSPFYCGRRADPRTKAAWKKIRLTSTGQDEDVSKDTGWEDCHEWSWPYSTQVLAEIGRVSGKVYKDLGEGIGRSGLSISSIATGPTIWGDVALYISRYSALKGGSSDPNSPMFGKFLAQAAWQSIIEMQTGAYSRYTYLPNNLNATFAEDIQKQFSMFTNKSTARAKFLEDAKKSVSEGKAPAYYNPKTGARQELTPDQAADYCMSIVDAWFNGTFPRPTAEYQQVFNKKDWDSDVLEKLSRAHIRLKNWAIDIGLPQSQRKGHSFPSDAFTINFFGLNKASQIAIQSYNSVIDENAIVTNPLQLGINQTKHYSKEEKVLTSINRQRPTPVALKPPVMIAAAATIATVAIISKLGGRK